MSIFIARESPDGNWQPIIEELPVKMVGGSWGVLQARILGISFPDYLKFCINNGGTLCGREGYSYCYFKNKSDCQAICNILNKEWKEVEKLWKVAP